MRQHSVLFRARPLHTYGGSTQRQNTCSTTPRRDSALACHRSQQVLAGHDLLRGGGGGGGGGERRGRGRGEGGKKREFYAEGEEKRESSILSINVSSVESSRAQERCYCSIKQRVRDSVF